VLACLFATASLLSAQTPKPDRIVQDQTIVSDHDPRITITLPNQAQYVGADRWILYNIADCELHIFVEANANKVVQRLYWIQFEAYVPSRPELKHNYTDPVEQIQGIDFHVKSHFAATDERDTPGSDTEHVHKLLQSAGFIAPKSLASVRLVHLLDPQMRKELMIIYAETLDSIHIAPQDPAPAPNHAPGHPQLERELLHHATTRIHFSNLHGM
jgi:hypothetical protein